MVDIMLTVIDCEKPTDMSNATVSYNGTTFEVTAIYTCEVGFKFPSGAKHLVTSCSDSGNWTGPSETCEGDWINKAYADIQFKLIIHIHICIYMGSVYILMNVTATLAEMAPFVQKP